MTTRIEVALSDAQKAFLDRVGGLNSREFIAGLVDRAMREAWATSCGGGRLETHNWEGTVALYGEEITDADPVDLVIARASYEGTLRAMPTTPEEQERLIAELDTVAADTPRDSDQVNVVTTLRLPLGVYLAIERHALAGNPKPADLMRRWVVEGLARDAADDES